MDENNEKIALAYALAASEEIRAANKGAEAMVLLLNSWQEKGLTTPDKAAEYLRVYRTETEALTAVFAACDLAARPTAADHEWYRECLRAGFSRDDILSAARKAALVRGNKLAYIRKVLEGAPEGRPSAGKTVRAQQYEQRSYTEEQLAGIADDPILKALEGKNEQ